MDKPSEKYRLMIYFAVATFHLYRKTIKENKTSLANFREQHPELIQRVFDEGKNIFNYELSCEQMDRAIKAYLAEAQSVFEQVAYKC